MPEGRPVKTDEQKKAEAEARAAARKVEEEEAARKAKLESEGAEAEGGTRDPERRFAISEMLARSEHYLSVPRHIVAAALHGRDEQDEVTLNEVRQAVDGFLNHEVEVEDDEGRVAA